MMILADSIPSISAVWIVLIALCSVASNIATVVIAIATFRKQRTEVSFSPNYVAKHDFEAHVASEDRDGENQWKEINQIKKDVGQIPDRLFALLANAGVIERKAK